MGVGVLVAPTFFCPYAKETLHTRSKIARRSLSFL